MSVYSEARQSVSCVEACERYGVQLDRHGFARCPFHGEKTASFKAYPGDKGFHCFGCGQSGSVIDLVMKLFDCSALDACKRLSDDFRLDLFQADNLSRAERLAQNKAEWERKRQQRELDKRHAKLIADFNEAVKSLRTFETMFSAYAPTDPEAEWDPRFVEAARNRDAARARADEALEILNKFEKARFAS